MSRGELVTELWPPCLADQHLDQCLVVFCVTYHDLVYVAGYGGLVGHGRIFVRNRRGLASECVIRSVGWSLLVDINVAWVDTLTNTRKAIHLNYVIFLCNLSVFVKRCVSEAIEAKEREFNTRGTIQ